MLDHDVVADYAGFGRRPRYTCNSCGETLVAQPHMKQRIWEEKEEVFLAEHPTTKVNF